MAERITLTKGKFKTTTTSAIEAENLKARGYRVEKPDKATAQVEPARDAAPQTTTKK